MALSEGLKQRIIIALADRVKGEEFCYTVDASTDGHAVNVAAIAVHTTAIAANGLEIDNHTGRIVLLEEAGGGTGTPKLSVSFDYLSPFPLDFGSLAPGVTITRSQVVIDVPFDDPGAMISLGTADAPDSILSTNDIDPNVASTYSSEGDVLVQNQTAARLKVVPGNSGQGSGRVLILLA